MAEAPAVTAYGPVPMARLLRYSDVLLAGAAILIVVMMVVPMPSVLLDFLLAVNITGAIIIMLTALYTLEPLQFAAFPSILLLSTLFRLALEVSATRLILLDGHTGDDAAGEVIKTFGLFVVGGNYFVGAVVFLILVVIQFVVITSGAQRVAEVAARFTLDAMPGKQMAIDADLNAGLITDDEARRRRRLIQREADFYGAMDGASKFVRGDAIAAIVVILINILAGFGIGILMHDMPALDVLKRYTLLTIGNGLVVQIPALLISTATGLVVTRAASDAHLGADVAKQLLSSHRVLYIAAAMLAFFGLIFGVTSGLSMFLPFGLLAVAAFTGGAAIRRARQRDDAVDRGKVAAEKAPAKGPEDVTPLLAVDPMEFEVSLPLVPLVDAAQGGDVLDRITALRRQVALEMGIVVPPIRVRDNLQLSPNTYVIRIRGTEVSRGEVRPGEFLAISASGARAPLQGVDATDPAFGLPAKWIGESQREVAERAGYTVVDASSVVATHLSEVIRSYAWEFLTRAEVQRLVGTVKASNAAAVDELIPGLMTVGEVQKVLQALVRERVSIRDLSGILETLADFARSVKDLDQLAELARANLHRAITRQHASPDGTLHVVTLDPAAEQTIVESLQRSERGVVLNLEPRFVSQLFASLAREIERMAGQGHAPVLLVSSTIRPHVKRLVERLLPRLVVLSFNEVTPKTNVQSLGTVAAQPV